MKKNKTKKIILILSILVITFVVGYILYNNFYNKKEKYVLEKYIEIDVSISKNAGLVEKDGIIFLSDTDNDYLKIYDENGKDITPKEIDNKILTTINQLGYDNDFLGYTVITDSKGYFINNKGKITLDLEATEASNMLNEGNYIKIFSDKVCNTYEYDGTEYSNPCIKIYDLEGNLLIDGTKENYSINIVVYDKNNKTLFEAEENNHKNPKRGIIDKNGNIIINFNYLGIEYLENTNTLLAKKDDKTYHLYDIDGKLLKEINLDDIKITKENQYEFGGALEAEWTFYLNNTIYLIDKNYELKEYDDIYYTLTAGMKDYGKKFYITDSIYIKNTNNTYTVHNLNGQKIIDEEFKFVGPANGDGYGSINVPNNYITLCKNSNRTDCGAIDFEGNVIINFENELNNYQESHSDDGVLYASTFDGFKNRNQYFDIVDGKTTSKLTCDNLNDIDIKKYFKNVIIVSDEKNKFDDGKTKIIDYNCNDLSEVKYLNICEYDNFIVAQNKDWTTYDVYDTNGIIIDYENKDKGKLTNFLGYSKEKLYFGYQNNIYILTKIQ